MNDDAHVYTDEAGDEVIVGHHRMHINNGPDAGGIVNLPENPADRWRLARAVLGDLGELRLLAPDETPVAGARAYVHDDVARVIEEAGIGRAVARQLAERLAKEFDVFHATPRTANEGVPDGA